MFKKNPKITRINEKYQEIMNDDRPILTPGSPPCRLVLMVIAALKLNIKHHLVDLKANEQLSPEFLKINPQHTVPTIVDDGFTLWESRAIARYLVNKFSTSAELYPTGPQERALVDQNLDFDLGTLCPSFSQYFYPQLFTGAPPTSNQIKKLEESLKLLEMFLEGKQFAVGANLTIADLALVTTVSSIDASEFKLDSYPNICTWFQHIKSTALGYQEFNEAGLQEFKLLVAEVKKVKAQAAGSMSQANKR